MLSQHLIEIVKLVLFVKLSHSFKLPKHNVLSYYKTINNVFLTNPFNHTTSYGIYVAGQTITIDIPSDIVNVYDILNWKVVNVVKNRLMFVHNNKPLILIDQKTIRRMNHSNGLSDSIIAFGDNEALHVPTIFNPNLTGPVPKWNYIELLHFDDEKEKVSVIRSLPWRKNDDWKFIKEWKMTDYTHFNDKLYLLIKRSIWNEKAAKVTQEISIIRMCLDKGRELISSAIEIRYTLPDFFIEIIDSNFKLYPYRNTTNSSQNLTLNVIRQFNSTHYHESEHSIPQFEELFERGAKICASGNESNTVTLLQNHLRFESSECKKSTHKLCSSNDNFIPSFDITNEEAVIVSPIYFLENYHPLSNKYQFVSLQHPFYQMWSITIDNMKMLGSSHICYSSESFHYCNSTNQVELQYFVNQRPLGGFFVTKLTNQIIFVDKAVKCEQLTSCIYCIMYGLYFNCVWSNSICTYDDQPKNKIHLTVDHCFKIVQISPLNFTSSSSNFTVVLDEALDITKPQEYLVIEAGSHNHCTNVKINGTIIKCSMNQADSGEFNVHVNLMSDNYVDVAMISAKSTDKVTIFASGSEYIYPLIVIIFLILSYILLCSFLVMAYLRCNEELIERFRKFFRLKKATEFFGANKTLTQVKSQILSSTMKSLTDSTFTNEPSTKMVKSWTTMPSVSQQLYISKQVH
uniref:Uncharacterized protein n=1 Tax=Tetranychus urticae TaxID=32264 RepID=A0A158P4X0_TETUR